MNEILPNPIDLTDEDLKGWYLGFLAIHTPEMREIIELHVLAGKTCESLFLGTNEQLANGTFELLKSCFQWRRRVFISPFLNLIASPFGFTEGGTLEMQLSFPDDVDLTCFIDKPKRKRKTSKRSVPVADAKKKSEKAM